MRRLRAAGVGERQARRVLTSGLLGEPVRTSASLLVDDETLDELLARPVLDPQAARTAIVDAWRADGLLGGEVVVTRREVDPRADPRDQIARLADGWAMSPWTATFLGSRAWRDQRVALLATTGGFVTAGFDLRGLAPTTTDRVRFELAPPGAWFDRVSGTRLPTGPGREWVLLGDPWPRRLMGRPAGPA